MADEGRKPDGKGAHKNKYERPGAGGQYLLTSHQAYRRRFTRQTSKHGAGYVQVHQGRVAGRGRRVILPMLTH